MTTKFNMTHDVAGYNGFGTLFTQDIRGCTLAANTEQHFTVPSNYPSWLAILSFTPGANVFVAVNATAAVPSGTMGVVNASLNKSGLQVKKGDVISLITPDDNVPYVTVELQATGYYQN